MGVSEWKKKDGDIEDEDKELGNVVAFILNKLYREMTQKVKMEEKQNGIYLEKEKFGVFGVLWRGTSVVLVDENNKVVAEVFVVASLTLLVKVTPSFVRT